MSSHTHCPNYRSFVSDTVERILFFLGTKREIHSLPVSINDLPYEGEEVALEKLGVALDLIATYAPHKYKSLKQQVASIHVLNGIAGSGSFRPSLKMVRLCASYVVDPETTHPEIACSLIHEAQHGRLRRLGIGYEEAIRTRVERICMTAERNFARKLPGCEELVEVLQDRIDLDWTPFLTNEALWQSEHDAQLQQLKDMGVPAWITKYMERLTKKRLG